MNSQKASHWYILMHYKVLKYGGVKSPYCYISHQELISHNSSDLLTCLTSQTALKLSKIIIVSNMEKQIIKPISCYDYIFPVYIWIMWRLIHRVTFLPLSNPRSSLLKAQPCLNVESAGDRGDVEVKSRAVETK